MKKDDFWKTVAIVAVIVIIILAIYSLFAGDIQIAPPVKCTSNGFECGDCIDNDGDDKIDYYVLPNGKVKGDPECDSLTDDTEALCAIACNVNLDCGISGYIGDPYCLEDGNSYRDYLTYTCNNAGKCSASCTSNIASQIWDYCEGQGCSDGECKVGSCNDTDGGFFIEITGTVVGIQGDDPYSYTDYCLDNSTLREYYCGGPVHYNIDYSCNDGNYTSCLSGACV